MRRRADTSSKLRTSSRASDRKAGPGRQPSADTHASSNRWPTRPRETEHWHSQSVILPRLHSIWSITSRASPDTRWGRWRLAAARSIRSIRPRAEPRDTPASSHAPRVPLREASSPNGNAPASSPTKASNMAIGSGSVIVPVTSIPSASPSPRGRMPSECGTIFSPPAASARFPATTRTSSGAWPLSVSRRTRTAREPLAATHSTCSGLASASAVTDWRGRQEKSSTSTTQSTGKRAGCRSQSRARPASTRASSGVQSSRPSVTRSSLLRDSTSIAGASSTTAPDAADSRQSRSRITFGRTYSTLPIASGRPIICSHWRSIASRWPLECRTAAQPQRPAQGRTASSTKSVRISRIRAADRSMNIPVPCRTCSLPETGSRPATRQSVASRGRYRLRAMSW